MSKDSRCHNVASLSRVKTKLAARKKDKAVVCGKAGPETPRKAKSAVIHSVKPAAGSGITLSRRKTFDEINLAARVIPAKPTMPVIGNLLFAAANGSLQVRATNLDLELRTACEIDSAVNFSFGVNGRKLREIVALLPSDEFSICLDGAILRVECGAVHYKLPIIRADQFPAAHQQPEGAFVLPPNFRELIRSVLFCVGEEADGPAYALNGVKLEISPNGGLRAVGTDNHTLSLAETDCQTGSDIDLLLPERTMEILIKLLDGNESCVMRYGESIVQFEAAGRVLSSRVLTSAFPDYRTVLPNYEMYATVDSVEFKEAVKRMELCSSGRNNGAYVLLRTGRIDFRTVSADNDEAEDSIPAKLTLDREIKTGLNAGYLRRFLSAAPKGEILIYFKDGKSAFDLRPGSCQWRFRHLVMPMNLGG